MSAAKIANEIAELRRHHAATLKVVREALRPFASACTLNEREDWHDNICPFSGLASPTIGDLRRAKIAFEMVKEVQP